MLMEPHLYSFLFLYTSAAIPFFLLCTGFSYSYNLWHSLRSISISCSFALYFMFCSKHISVVEENVLFCILFLGVDFSVPHNLLACWASVAVGGREGEDIAGGGNIGVCWAKEVSGPLTKDSRCMTSYMYVSSSSFTGMGLLLKVPAKKQIAIL